MADPVAPPVSLWRRLFALGIAFIACVLSWVMLFGVLSGNWWAIGGYVFAITMSATMMWLTHWIEKS